MASPLLNYVYSDYLSADGNTYSIRTDAAWAANAASGCTTTSTARRYGADSRQRHRRKALYADSTGNGRTRLLPVCTPTAEAALEAGTAGQTLTYAVPGSATASTFNFVRVIPEKVAGRTIRSHATAFP